MLVQDRLEGSALRVDWPERGIARIQLTRESEMNTLSFEFLDEFAAAFDMIDQDGTRALIVTGQGRAFCCGAHLKYFAGPQPILINPFDARDKYLMRIATLFDRLEELHFPTIAAINGFALGGGCELALSCDFRIMAAGAKIGLPETRLGAVAGAGGVQKLIRHVGRSRALDWILRGTHISSEVADRAGLCASVVPAKELMPAAIDLALELRRLAPRAIAQSKWATYLSEDADLRVARKFGVEALSMLVGGKEWTEGMQAFTEKREARFNQW